MKQKLLTLLKPKLANKGFSQKTIEGLADYLITQNLTLTEESTDEDINTAIDGVIPVANLMQAENTRYANEIKSKLPKAVEESKKPDPDTEDPNETPQDKLLKQILEQNKVLFDEIATIKGEKITISRRDQYAKVLEGKEPGFVAGELKKFDKMAFADDEDFKTTLAEFTQDITNSGLGGDNVPNGLSKMPLNGKIKPATKDELDSVVSNLKI